MTQRARTTLPVALSAVVGVTAAGLMFVPRGDAAPPSPTSFSAEVTGEVWRVNRIDANPADSTPAQTVDVGVARVQGRAGSVVAPGARAIASAHNLAGDPAPAGRVGAESTATAALDPASTATANGPAGTLPNALTYAASAMSGRARWVGDDTCLPATTPMTSSRSASTGSATVPMALPEGTPPLLPLPSGVPLPSDIPTSLPSDFPTGLPSDLPLPTLLPTGTPTGLPTELPTGLPTGLPTDLPTILPTDLPTTLLPTNILGREARAEGDVVLASVAAARVDERTLLETIPGTDTNRRVSAESVATVIDPTKPVMSFFGDEATLRMTGTPTLSAYSQGGENGSQVTWTPPTALTLDVGSDSYAVPQDGSALALPWSQNEDVVLTVSAGTLSSAESPSGELAQAAVSVLNVLVKNGDQVLLDAELFPMTLKVTAPAGGIDCSLPEPPDPVKPGARLTGKDNGKKADKLVLKAITQATGAKATVYRVVGGKQKKAAAGKLDRKGDRTFTIKDRNGKKPTKYVVKIAPTDLTKGATLKDKVR